MPTIAIVLVLGLIVLLITFFTSSEKPEVVTKPDTKTEVIHETEIVTESKDGDNRNETDSSADTETENSTKTTGDFSGKSSYTTPANVTFSVEVSLSLADNIITDASVIYDGKINNFSTPFQERFDQAYQKEVIGKDINTVSLSRIGGASLTSQAFNEAVKNIIAENQS